MNWFRENISYDVKKTLLMNLRELKGSKSKPKDDAAMHLEVKNTQKKKQCTCKTSHCVYSKLATSYCVPLYRSN
jgi:hypothetical protein